MASDRRTVDRVADDERWFDAAQLRARQQRHRRRRLASRCFRALPFLCEALSKRRRRRSAVDRRSRHMSPRDRANIGERSPTAISVGEKRDHVLDCQPSIGRQRKHRLEYGCETVPRRRRVEVNDADGRRLCVRDSDNTRVSHEEQDGSEDRCPRQKQFKRFGKDHSAGCAPNAAAGIPIGCGLVGYGHEMR